VRIASRSHEASGGPRAARGVLSAEDAPASTIKINTSLYDLRAAWSTIANCPTSYTKPVKFSCINGLRAIRLYPAVGLSRMFLPSRHDLQGDRADPYDGSFGRPVRRLGNLQATVIYN
jgi:hypothetical protein